MPIRIVSPTDSLTTAKAGHHCAWAVSESNVFNPFELSLNNLSVRSSVVYKFRSIAHPVGKVERRKGQRYSNGFRRHAVERIRISDNTLGLARELRIPRRLIYYDHNRPTGKTSYRTTGKSNRDDEKIVLNYSRSTSVRVSFGMSFCQLRLATERPKYVLKNGSSKRGTRGSAIHNQLDRVDIRGIVRREKEHGLATSSGSPQRPCGRRRQNSADQCCGARTGKLIKRSANGGGKGWTALHNLDPGRRCERTVGGISWEGRGAAS